MSSHSQQLSFLASVANYYIIIIAFNWYLFKTLHIQDGAHNSAGGIFTLRLPRRYFFFLVAEVRGEFLAPPNLWRETRGEWGGVIPLYSSESRSVPEVARVLILGDGTRPLGSGAL